MNKLKKVLKNLWEDESGQGATEYILMLVVVVAIIMAFKPKIEDIIGKKTEAAGGKMDDVFQP